MLVVCHICQELIPYSFLFYFVFPFQDHVKEKLKLVQKFLHVDAQDQLASLEKSMESSEITMVRNSLQHENNG